MNGGRCKHFKRRDRVGGDCWRWLCSVLADGGKSRVAAEVWSRFGDVPNYVEPFAGSLAVLLGRPHAARTETVNDKDCYLANFWRAVSVDPLAVAHYCDWPVNEADTPLGTNVARGEFWAVIPGTRVMARFAYETAIGVSVFDPTFGVSK